MWLQLCIHLTSGLCTKRLTNSDKYLLKETSFSGRRDHFLTGPTWFPSTVAASVTPMLCTSTRFSCVRGSAYCTHQEIPAFYGIWYLIAILKEAHQWILFQCIIPVVFYLQLNRGSFESKRNCLMLLSLSWRHVSDFVLGHLQVTRYKIIWTVTWDNFYFISTYYNTAYQCDNFLF